MSEQLQRRTRTTLERVESWAQLKQGDRKRRAARAIRDEDNDTLAGLLRAYIRLQGRSGMDSSPHTLETYCRGMRKLVGWCDAKAVKPHQIGTDEASRYRASLQRDYAKATVSIYLTGARRFLDALQWAGLADGNPFDGVTVQDPTARAAKADPYTVEEIDKLLEAANLRERVMVLLAADGGLRLSEIASLEWQNVDPGRQQLDLMGKGHKRRKPAITKRLRRALQDLRASQPDGTKEVLTVGRERIKQLMTALCERAGVNPRGIHQLRHSCGTRLYKETRDLLIVARHLGHSTTKTTELYAELDDTDYRTGVAKLEEDDREPVPLDEELGDPEG